MIRLDDQNIRTADRSEDFRGHTSGISNKSDFPPAFLEGIADRLCRVVRNAKRLHRNIADPKAVTAPDDLKRLTRSLRILLRCKFIGPARSKDRFAAAFLRKQRADALDMIDMLMRQHDAVELCARKPAGRKTLFCLFCADADIDQHPGVLALYQKTVPRAAAGEGTNR